jgi:hypothetical protein
MNFLPSHGLKLSVAAAGSAGTDVNGAVIDMQGKETVTGFVSIATANAGNFLKFQQTDDAGGTNPQDVAGSKVVAASNGQVVALEVVKPSGRFGRFVVVRGGANTATGDLYTITHELKTNPAGNPSNDVAGANGQVTKIIASPALGTP